MRFSRVYIYPKLLSAGGELTHGAPMISLPVSIP